MKLPACAAEARRFGGAKARRVTCSSGRRSPDEQVRLGNWNGDDDESD